MVHGVTPAPHLVDFLLQILIGKNGVYRISGQLPFLIGCPVYIITKGQKAFSNRRAMALTEGAYRRVHGQKLLVAHLLQYNDTVVYIAGIML